MNPRELAAMSYETRSRLGRGLASLIGDVGGEAAHVDRPRNQRKVPIEFLKPNPRNPRRTFLRKTDPTSAQAKQGSTIRNEVEIASRMRASARSELSSGVR